MYQMQTNIRTPIGLLPKLREAVGDFTCAYVAEQFGDLLPTWDVLVAEGRISAAVDKEGMLSIRMVLQDMDCWLDDIKGLAEMLAPFVTGHASIEVFGAREQVPVAVFPIPNGFPYRVQ